jgi:fucose permease
MTAGFAANYLTGTMVCFFIGRLPAPGYPPLRAA